MTDTFTVQAGSHPFCTDARDILLSRIEERSGARHESTGAPFRIALDVQDIDGPDAFSIAGTPDGVGIVGHSRSGLLAGIGQFLRTSRYAATGFTPSSWRGDSVPAAEVRGVYFATHFQNWYVEASEDEICRYLEDLCLWGVNHLMVAFPIIHLTGWDDPEADAYFDRFEMFRRMCHRLGARIGTLTVPNQDFRIPRPDFVGTPNRDDFGRKGDHGNNTCPSKPGATEFLLANYDEFLQRLGPTPPDFTGFWPYDEGGCGCDACYPWGGNGYLRLCGEMADRARAAFPGVRLILSTWVFDTPEAGEWKALAESMDEHGPWVDCILADAHEDFPQYPLEQGAPGGVPLINFPEISMWELGPWGGFGANPLPERFQRLWDQVSHVVRGGFPYSEGISEDINKALVLGFYWDPARSADETLREYAAYEYPGADPEDVVRLVREIEANHVATAEKRLPDLERARHALEAADRIDADLVPLVRGAWRWRILYLRALLDMERYTAAVEAGAPLNRDWGSLVAENPAAQEAFRELVTIYHCRDTVDESCPQHAWVRPPLA